MNQKNILKTNSWQNFNAWSNPWSQSYMDNIWRLDYENQPADVIQVQVYRKILQYPFFLRVLLSDYNF